VRALARSQKSNRRLRFIAALGRFTVPPSGYAEARGAIPLSAASEKGAAFCGDSERNLETPRRVSRASRFGARCGARCIARDLECKVHKRRSGVVHFARANPTITRALWQSRRRLSTIKHSWRLIDARLHVKMSNVHGDEI
jgi:hypothetical protein